MWKLPTLGELGTQAEPVWEEVYPFTHHRVTLRVYVQKAPSSAQAGQQWISAKDLKHVPLAAAHRRAIEALLVST
jgi:hypothetical protein